MDNVTQHTVVRQLLSLLPLDVQDRLRYADRYAKKLTISKSILVFILAQFISGVINAHGASFHLHRTA